MTSASGDFATKRVTKVCPRSRVTEPVARAEALICRIVFNGADILISNVSERETVSVRDLEIVVDFFNN
jgi:hypothetical protein